MVLCIDIPKKLVCRLTIFPPGLGGLMIGHSRRLNCGVDEVTQDRCALEEETAESRTGKAKRGESIQSHTEDDLEKEKYNGGIGSRMRNCHHETGKSNNVDSIRVRNVTFMRGCRVGREV
jgi:hypothetical protein